MLPVRVCRRKRVKLPVLLALVWVLLPAPAGARETQLVLGAGPSTAAVELFFRHFSELPVARDYEFIVEPRSIKHAGGLQAAEKYLFGRTGRPLSTEEKTRNKHDLFIARIPINFVAGRKTGIRRISQEQLRDIFTRSITNWKELGGTDAEIILAGREPTEAAFSALKRILPFCSKTEFDIVFTRDHQLVNFIESSAGDYAIGFGARPNFDDSQIIQVDGIEMNLNTGLVFDTKNLDHPVVKAAIEFAKSSTWLSIVFESGLLPPQH